MTQAQYFDTKQNLSSPPLPKKIMFASLIGGALEFYDFSLYGTLAFAFAPLFFPSDKPFVSILSAYLVFAVGFFARPLGSIIFGHLGDRFGRRFALFWSLTLMSLATLMMGLLPTYESIGLLAPIFMVVARLLQGLSAGGEYSGALIFAIEHGAKKRAGMIGSFIATGCMSGLLFSSLASTACALPQAPEWSWRIPFLAGFFVSLVGIYVRFRLEETPSFVAQKQSPVPYMPFLKSLRSNLRDLLSVLLLAGFNGIALYVYFVFLPSFIAKETLLAESLVKLYSSGGIVLLMLMLMLFGSLSDIIHRTHLIKIGALLNTLTAALLFYYLPSLSLSSIFIYQCLFVISFGMYSGPLNTFIIERFQVGVRYRCASLGYSLGMGVIGGSAPLVAGVLSMHPQKYLLLALYFVIGGMVALGTLWHMERHTRTFKDPIAPLEALVH